MTTLRELKEQDPEALLNSIRKLSEEEAEELLYCWGEWARPEQMEPPGDWWNTWLILAGRGFGKTRTGAEWVRQKVPSLTSGRITLIGETAADVRDVMIEGPSGILSVYPKRERPEYQPSKRRVVWPNGAVGIAYSAEDPDQLRGVNSEIVWADEVAAWTYAQETWDQLMFGLRIGQSRAIATTTPRPIKLIRNLMEREGHDVYVTRGSTRDNFGNLSAAFRNQIIAQYEGTRLGRQEIDGQILEDVPGALWQRSVIEGSRRSDVSIEDMKRVVVAVDPGGSTEEGADETGIVVAGLGKDDYHGYVFADRTFRGHPSEWSRTVCELFHTYKGDLVVAEKNYGGNMVSHTLSTYDRSVPVKLIHAKKGKIPRAEPIAALYEQGKIHHVGRNMEELEDEMCTYNGEPGKKSPNRLDALVYALLELMPEKRSFLVSKEFLL